MRRKTVFFIFFLSTLEQHPFFSNNLLMKTKKLWIFLDYLILIMQINGIMRKNELMKFQKKITKL